MSWIEDIISPQTRKWEEFYKIVFSTIELSEVPMG